MWWLLVAVQQRNWSHDLGNWWSIIETLDLSRSCLADQLVFSFYIVLFANVVLLLCIQWLHIPIVRGFDSDVPILDKTFRLVAEPKEIWNTRLNFNNSVNIYIYIFLNFKFFDGGLLEIGTFESIFRTNISFTYLLI